LNKYILNNVFGLLKIAVAFGETRTVAFLTTGKAAFAKIKPFY
jgi:hypothetical protein